MARFRKLQLTAKDAHEMLADQGLEDARELTHSTDFFGKARIKELRRQHHPFGRRLSNPSGRVRGPKGTLPYLPIGEISGKLHSRMRKTKVSGKGSQSFGVGPKGVGYARFILGKTGTRKMVARGYAEEIQKRWKARNKAFLDHFKEQQKQ